MGGGGGGGGVRGGMRGAGRVSVVTISVQPAACFSYPRLSVSSPSNARSIRRFVSSLTNPPSPTASSGLRPSRSRSSSSLISCSSAMDPSSVLWSLHHGHLHRNQDTPSCGDSGLKYDLMVADGYAPQLIQATL